MRERVLRKGRVIDAEGRPVSGALVSVTWGTAPTPDIARRTDDDGAFHVALPPGRFRLRAAAAAAASAAEGQPRTGEVEVQGADGPDAEIVIRLAARKE